MFTTEQVKGDLVRSVRELYRQAFPEYERIPFWSLRARALKKDFDLLAFCDDGIFCGFACASATDDAIYVHYLAVAEDRRGRGYGGRILDALAQRYGERAIALDIEAVRPGTKNAKQRSQRKKFYLRNGFKESGFGFKDGGDMFEVLVRGPKLERETYGTLINKLAFGLTKIEPFKM